MKYTPTIGLEIHAELATEAKMFCGCKNAPHGAEPNTFTCPVCLAHPGTLPVANERAIEMVLLFGEAVGATKADFSEFDRKNYFYPDIPKAYQISQYQFPFLTGGSLCGCELTRVHLEEDTARSSHEIVDGSLVDFNRAGVPLMELVTEPVLHDATSAGAFARELQLLLQTLGISNANMERGEMRIEVNLSLSTTAELGTKVEVKNINSFKAVEAAIAYEIARQTELLEAGGAIVQETRGWDENKARTFSQRTKETAKDYRYFPDPDLPKLKVPEKKAWSNDILSEKMPILPAEKRQQYSSAGVPESAIEVIITDRQLDPFFARVFATTKSDAKLSKLAANYLAVDVAGLIAGGDLRLTDVDPDSYVALMQLINAGKLGSKNAKALLPELATMTGDITTVVEERGLLQQSDSASLAPLIEQIVTENESQVAEYRAGKETVLKYLVGQGMKLSKGTANPQILEAALKDEIT